MFTGIVQCIGTVAAIALRDGDCRFRIAADGLNAAQLRIGDSIAVSGACLTAILVDGTQFAADVSAETLSCTTLGNLVRGSAVNLESALRAGDPLGGHLVTGHVDGVGELLGRRADARSERFDLRAPAALARYIARKGSICVDGVSLTVNEVHADRFEVNLIPHTLEVTTLGALRPGAQLNLEVDLIARYLERLSQPI